MTTDPIADMLTQINNAHAVHKDCILLPYSKLKHALAEKLTAEGIIAFANKKNRKSGTVLELGLLHKKEAGTPIKMRRVSRPSRRVYRKSGEMYSGKTRKGLYVISTPKGLLTNTEAHKEGVGGEVLLEIR